VDDLKEVRDLVEKTLRTNDRLVLKAEDGATAVDVAKAEKPDLIMMDITMPGTVDGLEATRIIKSDPETKNCIVIMLTAKGQEGDKEAGFAAGADGYFIKPFSPLELMRKVDEVLG
jgi:CheY-like chemotaxis protein